MIFLNTFTKLYNHHHYLILEYSGHPKSSQSSVSFPTPNPAPSLLLSVSMPLAILDISCQSNHTLCNQPHFPYELPPHWVAVKIYSSSNLAANNISRFPLQDNLTLADFSSLKYTLSQTGSPLPSSFLRCSGHRGNLCGSGEMVDCHPLQGRVLKTVGSGSVPLGTTGPNWSLGRWRLPFG